MGHSSMTQATDTPLMSHPIPSEDVARESVLSGDYSALDGEELEDFSDDDADENGPLGLQCLPHLSRRVRLFILPDHMQPPVDVRKSSAK